MSKKLLIFGGLGLLLLLGGGGAGLYFAGMLPFAGGGEETDVAAADDEAEKSGDRGEANVEMKPISAPVMKGRRVHHNILLTLSIEIADSTARDDVARLMPRIRDAMLRDLYRTPVIRNRETGRYDLDQVKARMLKIARSVLSQDLVRDVLVLSAIRLN